MGVRQLKPLKEEQAPSTFLGRWKCKAAAPCFIVVFFGGGALHKRRETVALVSGCFGTEVALSFCAPCLVLPPAQS